MRNQEQRNANAAYARQHRAKVRERGGVIVYAMLTSPEAIKAWKTIQAIHGTNRDAIEAAIIDYHEQLEQP